MKNNNPINAKKSDKLKINLYLSLVLVISFLIDSFAIWLTERELPSDFEALYMPIHFDYSLILQIVSIISVFFLLFGLVNGIHNMHEEEQSVRNPFKLIFKNFDVKKSLLFYLIYVIVVTLPNQIIEKYEYSIAEHSWLLGLVCIYLVVCLIFFYKFSLVPFLFRYENKLKDCFAKSWKLTSSIDYFKYLFKINIGFLLLFIAIQIIIYVFVVYVSEVDGYFFITLLPTFIVEMTIGVWAGWSVNVSSKMHNFVRTEICSNN